ncbi:MAG: hypothetical protein WDW36_003512 [Sanguina aurantia]
MENCKMRGLGSGGLSPQLHFDLLVSVFMGKARILPQDFELHCCLSQDNQARMPASMRENLNRRNQYVQVHAPLGKSAQESVNGRARKEDLHGLDVFIIDAMKRYISKAAPGDVLVLISGDGGFLDTLRTAVLERGMQVLLISCKGSTDLELASNPYVVSQHWDWVSFLSVHTPTTFGGCAVMPHM